MHLRLNLRNVKFLSLVSLAFICSLGAQCFGFQVGDSAPANIPNPFEYLPQDDKSQDDKPSEGSEPVDSTSVANSPDSSGVSVQEKPAASSTLEGEASTNDESEFGTDAQTQAEIAVNDPDLPDDVELIDDAPDEAELAIAEVPDQEVDQVLEKEFKRCLVVDLEGEISAPFYYYLNNRLDMAKSIGADLIVLKLTSPGGELEMSLELARRLRDINWATVVVLIPREAISGGAIISLGADRIYMVRGSLIGDAGPIKLGIRGFELADQKIVSYLTAALNELASSSGRPTAIAEAMADKSQVVVEVVDKQTKAKAYLRQEEIDQNPARYEIIGPIPEAGQDRFLTLGAEKALAYGLVEGVFASEDDLMKQLLVDEFQFTRMNWVDRTVTTLNNPWVSGLLLIVGLVGLYMELVAPGLSVAGLTAVVCFSVFFWSHALGGTSGWLEIMLFALAVFCLICELFVIPGFGVFGIVGLLLLVVSLVMASQDFVVPETAADWRSLQTNVLIVLGSVLGVMLLFFGQILLLDKIPGFSKFQLVTPADAADSEEGKAITSLTAGTGAQSAKLEIGMQGVADSDLRPSGKVYIEHRLVDVVTEGDYVEAGVNVEVIKVEGNNIVVRKVST